MFKVTQLFSVRAGMGAQVWGLPKLCPLPCTVQSTMLEMMGERWRVVEGQVWETLQGGAGSAISEVSAMDCVL